MKLIKGINDHYERENQQTKIVEPIPALEIELENHLTDDEKLDLQFDKLSSYQAYQEVFKKVFTFTNAEEMNIARDIIQKMMELQEAGEQYFISEGLNCSIAIEANDGRTIFDLKSPQLMDYIKKMIAWTNEPERYHGV